MTKPRVALILAGVIGIAPIMWAQSEQLPADERWTDFEALEALVDEAVTLLPVDPERIYLTGFSMGGGGVWRYANIYPNRFAAAAPLARRPDPESDDVLQAGDRVIVFTERKRVPEVERVL